MQTGASEAGGMSDSDPNDCGSASGPITAEMPSAIDERSNASDDRLSPRNTVVGLEETKNAGNTLFVFYIPPVWEEKDLQAHFEPFGSIDSCRVCRKPDGSSRGYGFVTYLESRAALDAIEGMNGLDVGENKRLKVQLKSSSEKQNTGAYHSSHSLHPPPPGCTIFIFHLPSEWSDADLKQHFSHFGRIVQCTVQRDPTGKSKGFGFVSFDRPMHAINAINGMNGFSAGSKFLKVTLKKGDEQYVQPPLLWHHPNGSASSSLMPPYSPHRPYSSAASILNRPPPYHGADMGYPSAHIGHQPPPAPPPYYSAPPPPIHGPMMGLPYHHMARGMKRSDHHPHHHHHADGTAGPSTHSHAPPNVHRSSPVSTPSGLQGSATTLTAYYGAAPSSLMGLKASQQPTPRPSIVSGTAMNAFNSCSPSYMGGAGDGGGALSQVAVSNPPAVQAGGGVYDYGNNTAAFAGQWNLQLG